MMMTLYLCCCYHNTINRVIIRTIIRNVLKNSFGILNRIVVVVVVVVWFLHFLYKLIVHFDWHQHY